MKSFINLVKEISRPESSMALGVLQYNTTNKIYKDYPTFVGVHHLYTCLFEMLLVPVFLLLAHLAIQ